MAIAQLAHQIKGNAIIAAQQAIRVLFQHSLQRVGALLVGFNAGADQRLVGGNTKFRQPAQIAAQAVGVDGVGAAAAQISDAACSHLEQHPRHLAGGAQLVVISLRYIVIFDASDGNKGHTVLLQQVNAGVIAHRAGEDDAVHFMAGQLALQLDGIGIADVTEQQIVPALRRHGADTAHTLAQKRQVQLHEVLGDHQRKIVCCTGILPAHWGAAINPRAAHIGKHLGAGLLAHTSFA